MNDVLPQKLLSFIGHFLKPYKRVVILYVGIAMLTGCWAPFNSLLIKYMINGISSSPSQGISFLIFPAALLVLNFIIFDNLTWRSIEYLNYKFQPLIKNQIIKETFEFVLGLSYQFFQDHLSGSIASQINTLADNIERILHRIARDFIRGAMLVLVAFISMYYVNPRFFWTLAVWFFIFSTYSIYQSKRLIDLSHIHASSESMISGQLVDSISNSSNVRIFARRVYEIFRLEKSLKITQEKFQTKEIFSLKLQCMQGLFLVCMISSMLYFLIQLYRRHLVSVGDFALIIGLSMEVGYITWYTMSQVDEFNEAVGKCHQSLSRLLVNQEIKDKEDALELHLTRGQITFSNVKFQYKNSKPLFHNLSITIEAGQKVGLVGYSGGGKSTLVKLILRIADVMDGCILIDGQDIRSVTQDSLHRHIAMIPQDPSLFHRTLMDNIRYSRIEATDEEVIEAAKKAHAHEFIEKLPLSYNSLVGERGVKLSGGQRQRIAIARAILKDAPLLILDEATSQLDSVTENKIQTSLWELMNSHSKSLKKIRKTTMVIAHRLSTLLRMDRIIVIDEGKIVEDGTHQELLAKQGLYKILWDAQIGGFLPDRRNEEA